MGGVATAGPGGGSPAWPRLFCGVDVGASATKLVLLDEDRRVRAEVVRSSGTDYARTARAALDEALSLAGLEPGRPPDRTVSTGSGRDTVGFADRAVTEIQGHGIGCHHHCPRAICVVDIGAQDNKVIHLDAEGRRLDFRMNRKCAAGTGSFLEEIALRLDLPLARLEPLARAATEAVRLSSFCTVFAKTEILSHLRLGAPVEHVVRGAFLAVVERVIEMDPLEGEIVLTGGVVAYNPTVAEILSDRIGRAVTVPPRPQLTGALGAALLAASR
jgi:(R)-2-hydroxyacyl-CoA dehydratese activating ATPase